MYNQNNGYADYVLIDLTNAADAKVDDANSVADFLFILKTTGNKTYVADDEYWQYEVVMDNEKTTKYIAESIGAKNGDLMRNVKENSKGYITDADPFINADRRDVITMSGTDTVNYSNGTLTVTGTNLDGTNPTSYVLKDDCKATLMVGGAADELLKDKDADYELYQTSVRSAAGILKTTGLTGTVYVAVDSDNGHVATDVYFYVSGAKEIAAPSNDTSIVSVSAGSEGTTTTTYNTQAAAEAAPLAIDWKSATYQLIVNTTDAGASAKVEFYNKGGSSVIASGTAPVTVDQKVAYTFKITVTAADGTVGTPVWVCVEPTRRSLILARALTSLVAANRSLALSPC